MTRLTIFLAAILMASVAAFAQSPVSVFSGRLTPLGHQETGSFTTSTAFPSIPATPPNVALYVYVYCTAAVIWRDDGTAPTSSTIGTIAATTWFWYSGNLGAFRMIPVTGAANCGINYYR